MEEKPPTGMFDRTVAGRQALMALGARIPRLLRPPMMVPFSSFSPSTYPLPTVDDYEKWIGHERHIPSGSQRRVMGARWRMASDLTYDVELEAEI